MGLYPSDWQDDAACKGMDTDIFFDVHKTATERAIEICLVCPVIEQCLSYAMRTEKGAHAVYRYGIFGGLPPEERAALDDSVRGWERNVRRRKTSTGSPRK